MKSYTDKKLAEFLPIESSDAHYWCKDECDLRLGGGFSIDRELDIPAWSLAALIEVMPDSVTDEDGVSYGLNICKNFVEYYNSSLGALCASYHSVNAVTTVDACVEMILKLHELKLL